MNNERLSNLSRLGRMLDEAIDLADACGESLIGAQIAQAIHSLDVRVAQLRSVSVPHDRSIADRGDGATEA